MINTIYTPFPSDDVSNKEKNSKEFGQKVGEAIESYWYNGSNLSKKRAWIDIMRSYSRGEQLTDYKKEVEGERLDKKNELDIKTHKINYDTIRILPTFKDIVINPIDESLFKPKAEAIDITAIDKKKKVLQKLEENFYTKDIAKTISQVIGTDITPKNVPQTEEELEIQKLEYKPNIEILEELGIENVMKNEKFSVIKDKINEDLFDLGHGVGRHYTDQTEGIKLKYVDPYNHLLNRFEYDDGRDIRYHAIVEKATIAELSKQAGGLEQKDLDAIKKLAVGQQANTTGATGTYVETEDGDRIVEFITFAYLMQYDKIYKKLRKNKSVKTIDRSDDETEYEPSNSSKKIKIPYQVWYEGVYVPIARVTIKWDKIPLQIEKGINEPITPFVIYAPKIKRLSEKGDIWFDAMPQRCKAFVDDLHRDHYKLQQLKMELMPAIKEIDTDAITNVVLSGVPIAGATILDLYFGRGVLLKRSVDDEGDPLPSAINEKSGGINNTAIGFLANEYANHLNKLRGVLGINELRDGTTKPNSKTAVTVQKLLLASSNNQTNHIPKASFKISLAFAEAISFRLADAIKIPALKKRYINIIGSDNVELLEEIQDIPMHKFGIYFDFRPDDEERITFEDSLIRDLTNGSINSAQYNKARQVRNTKSAIKYLEFVIEENTKKAEQIKLQNIQAQSNANAQASIQIEQSKQQTLTVSYEIQKQTLLLKSQFEDDSLKKKAILTELQKQKDHQRNLELESLKLGIKQTIENKKEEDKKDREDQRGTIQSKLIDQRKNGSGPIDFKNEVEDIFKDSIILDEK